MSIPAQTLQLHLEYTGWASRRLLDSAAQLNSEELTRDFKTADRSVLGTLVHIFAADRIWLARVQGGPQITFIRPEDRDFARLQHEWRTLHGRWQDWAATLTDEAASGEIAYTDLRGNAWKQPLWQIVLHVVNHGTHHRGAVSGFLRAMGHNPPPLDLTAFYRTR